LRVGTAIPRVLVVDDSADIRGMLQAQLEMEGFEVATAPDGARALALLGRERTDLIITDLFMPDKDGIETILEIREKYPAVQIVAMSGWDSRQGSDYLKVAREIGAVRTVKKPFELTDIVKIVRDLMPPS
jgi:DNA-binding response OmpR family regulator